MMLTEAGIVQWQNRSLVMTKLESDSRSRLREAIINLMPRW